VKTQKLTINQKISTAEKKTQKNSLKHNNEI